MDYENGAIGILGAAVTGIFGWAISLGSKVNVQESKLKGLAEVQDSKIDGLTALITSQYQNTDKRLERIERHMLNGHYERRE